MSLDPYYLNQTHHRVNQNLIKPTKKIDRAFPDSNDHNESEKNKKSFSDTFAELLEEEEDDDDDENNRNEDGKNKVK